MRTHKNRGGDIHAKSAFEKILSIGYEMESTDLAKLTLMSDGVFLNTDTATKDIAKINDPDLSEDNINFQEYTMRQEETFKEAAYNNGEVDKNIVFNITSDVARSPFVKELEKICSTEEFEDSTPSEIKNTMYRFRPGNYPQEDDIPINFVFWNDDPHCSFFSDVEWIFTHYKPAKSKSVIIDTFFLSASNLIRHLDGLEATTGRLLFKADEESKDITIRNPKDRVLFHHPNTNLYYLQTDNYKTPININNICLAPQMTFSAHISDLFSIMKQLASDSIRSIPAVQKKFDGLLTFLNMIEKFTQVLIDEFNERYPAYAITKQHKVLYKSIKNYMSLIFYKLHIYINDYYIDTIKNTATYLKDYLTFNSRHSNYILYCGLKKALLEYYGNKISEKNIVKLIHKLLLQQSILEEYLLDDIENVKKNALNPENKLNKKHQHYGNPMYSLHSYFQFFEDPLIAEKKIENNASNTPDWLVYTDIDIYSTPMDLKDHIVLTEFRGFGRILTSYMYATGNDEIEQLMTEGICNVRAKKINNPDMRGFSIATLREFIKQKYPAFHSNKTRRHRSARSASRRSASYRTARSARSASYRTAKSASYRSATRRYAKSHKSSLNVENDAKN